MTRQRQGDLAVEHLGNPPRHPFLAMLNEPLEASVIYQNHFRPKGRWGQGLAFDLKSTISSARVAQS